MLKQVSLTAFVVTVLLFSNTLYAESFQHYRFHKNFKSYAMGGAGVVQHGSVMTMFSNPANLRNFPEDEVEGEIFGTVINIGKNVTQFASDLSDAMDSGTEQEQNQNILLVLEKYMGKSLSGHVALTPIALAYNSDFYGLDAQGIGLVSAMGGHGRTHSGFGSEGVLEVNSLNYGGLVYGVASDFESVTVGINFKLMQYFALQKSFTVVDLIDDDLSDNILNNDLKKGLSIALDIGLNWEIVSGDGWDIVSGIVVNNLGGIGDSSLERAYIPTTLDLGMRGTYELTSYTPMAFSLDYVDISDAYQDEGDFQKRLNYGFDLRLFKSDYFDIGLQAGMHQSEVTFGGDLMLLGFINFGYASYSEELGVFAGQDATQQDVYYFAFSF